MIINLDYSALNLSPIRFDNIIKHFLSLFRVREEFDLISVIQVGQGQIFSNLGTVVLY